MSEPVAKYNFSIPKNNVRIIDEQALKQVPFYNSLSAEMKELCKRPEYIAKMWQGFRDLAEKGASDLTSQEREEESYRNRFSHVTGPFGYNNKHTRPYLLTFLSKNDTRYGIFTKIKAREAPWFIELHKNNRVVEPGSKPMIDIGDNPLECLSSLVGYLEPEHFNPYQTIERVYSFQEIKEKIERVVEDRNIGWEEMQKALRPLVRAVW